MKVEIKAIFPDGTIVLKKLSDTGEFPETPPVEGQTYTIYFEKGEDKVPEFNS